MIAVDATPLVTDPRRGVARALRARLAGWASEPPGPEIVLFAPRALELDGPFEVVVPKRPTDSHRAFRRRLPALLRDAGARVLYSPFSAFPARTVPTVVLVHELPFVRLGVLAEGPVRAGHHRRWLARDVAHAAAIVVPSEATRADVIALHPEADARVHVIANGFDPAPWRRAAEDAVPAARSSIVVVGTGHFSAGPWKKGMDVLHEALRALPDVRATLVGGCEGHVPSGIEIRTDLDDAALARLVASASCLVHPARSEGFGYPPLEAMAAGTPVVTTDGGALPEIVGDAALVVPAGDARALADGIRRVLGNAALREALIAAGRRRVGDPAFRPAAGARRLAALLAAVVADVEAGR